MQEQETKVSSLWANEEKPQRESILRLATMNQQFTAKQKLIKAVIDEMHQSNRCTRLQELREKGLQSLGNASYAEATIKAWCAQQSPNPIFNGDPADKMIWKTFKIWFIAILSTVAIATILGSTYQPRWFFVLFPIVVIAIISFGAICFRLSELARQEWVAVRENFDTSAYLEEIPELVLESLQELSRHLAHGETFKIQHVFLRQYHNWKNKKDYTDHPKLGGIILLNEYQRDEGSWKIKDVAVIGQW